MTTTSADADRIVVQYTDSHEFGGAERMVVQLSAALASVPNWHPIIVHHEFPELAPLVAEAKALGIETRALAPATINIVRVLAEIGGILRDARATVFHAHLPWPLSCRRALIGAKLARVPAIVASAHLHAVLPFPWQRAQVRMAPVDRYLAVSDFVARGLSDLGVNPARISIVHNGISVAADAIPSTTRATGAHSIATVARLVEQKGHRVLIEALKGLPDVSLVIVGDGPLRAALESMTREWGVADRVVFLGEVSDVPAVLAKAELFVLTSFNEGLPLAVLEAMAAGLPVVATRVGGTPELVIPGENGVLVDPGDPIGTRAAIRMLLDDPHLAGRFGRRGHEIALEGFTHERMVHAVVGVYEELLGLTRSRDPRIAAG
jgi:glycosyltransferase involved in cell wall biosynthesis